MSSFRILLVEDDAALAPLLVEYLRPHGFAVEVERRGDAAVQRVLCERPHLVILDLMLPGQDGLSICRQLRPAYGGPILMLTARGAPTDQVVGLEIGADDYLAKPAPPRVLLARIRALLRRGNAPVSSDLERLSFGDLVIDPRAREVRARDIPIALSTADFELLWLLATHAGQMLSRKYLYERLRGSDHDELDRSVDLRISRLRQKLAASLEGRQIIKTIRGVGYLFVR